jgi:hypothetical protein
MKKVLLGAAMLAMAGPAMAANIVVNGGFESPPIGGGFQQVDAPDAVTVPGWVVMTGSVDVVGAVYSPHAGAQAIDLTGESARGTSTLSQALSTVVGQSYRLSFFYSNNPQAGDGTYTATVSVAGLIDTISHTNVPGNMNWLQYTGYFTGTGSDVLSFVSGFQQNNGGIFLDSVDVSAVPEPATWGMLILGFGMAGGALRYRRRSLKVSFAR